MTDDHHDIDWVPHFVRQHLQPLDWLHPDTVVRMECGCPCLIQMGDILWVRPAAVLGGGGEVPVAVTRRGTAH